MGVDQVGNHVVGDADDVLAPLLAVEDVAAKPIDRLALLVHDVVVLEQVLADVEVARLDLLLGALDRARHHARLDRLALLHARACPSGP